MKAYIQSPLAARIARLGLLDLVPPYNICIMSGLSAIFLLTTIRNPGVSSMYSKSWTLTKQPGQTYDEYKACVFASTDAMQVKMADLRHNSDIRRLKGVTDRDVARIAKYMKFYSEIRDRLVDTLAE